MPIDRRIDFCLCWQSHTVQGPLFKFLKAGPVDDVADVFLAAGRIFVDIVRYVLISVEDDFDDAVCIHPLDKVLAKTRIFLAGSAQQGQTVIFLLAPGRCV